MLWNDDSSADAELREKRNSQVLIHSKKELEVPWSTRKKKNGSLCCCRDRTKVSLLPARTSQSLLLKKTLGPNKPPSSACRHVRKNRPAKLDSLLCCCCLINHRVLFLPCTRFSQLIHARPHGFLPWQHRRAPPSTILGGYRVGIGMMPSFDRSLLLPSLLGTPQSLFPSFLAPQIMSCIWS